MPHEPSLSVVGVDVSKARLDVYLDGPQRRFSVANDPAGVESLLGELAKAGVRLLVVEATGRYHRRLAAEAHAAGIPVAVANPQQVRSYAAATGRLEKTDKIDAVVLAEFGRRLEPRAVADSAEISSELADLVSRRRGLVQMRVAEKNRAHDELPKLIARQSKALLRMIEQQIEDLDRRIAQLIEADDESAGKSRLIDSVPGIGPDSANQLVVELPELGKLDRAKIAKLAGVAPLNCDSGNRRGQRHIRGGRADVRKILFMCAHNAVLRCDRFRDYFQGLIARGKKHKMAMTACMRKLLITLNQMVKTNTPWNPNYQTETA